MAQRVAFFVQSSIFVKYHLGRPLSSLTRLPTRQITAQDESFTAQHFLQWPTFNNDGPSITFCDFNRLFLKSIIFGAPLTTLTREPPSLRSQHKINRSQHRYFYIENFLAKMAQRSRFVISIAYFVKLSHSAPPWQLSHDSPPAIDHSTRWIVHSTELSTMTHF